MAEKKSRKKRPVVSAKAGTNAGAEKFNTPTGIPGTELTSPVQSDIGEAPESKSDTREQEKIIVPATASVSETGRKDKKNEKKKEVKKHLGKKESRKKKIKKDLKNAKNKQKKIKKALKKAKSRKASRKKIRKLKSLFAKTSRKIKKLKKD